MQKNLILISLLIFLNINSLQAIIKLKSDTIYTKINKNKQKQQKKINTISNPYKQISYKSNITIANNNKSDNIDIKINGVSNFRSVYSIENIPLTTETNSYFNINLINQALIKNIQINNSTPNSSIPIGSNINIITDLTDTNYIFLSLSSLKNLYINTISKLNNNSNIFTSYYNEKNQYKFLDNNSTLYNYNDDFYDTKKGEDGSGVSFAYLHKDIFNYTLINSSLSYKTIPFYNLTTKQKENYFMFLKKKKIIKFPFIFELNLYSHLYNTNIYDTTANYFDFTKRDIYITNLRTIIPLIILYPQNSYSIKFNTNTIYENSYKTNRYTKTTLVDFYRIKNINSLNITYNKIFDLNLALNNTLYFDKLNNSYIRDIYKTTSNYNSANNSFNGSIELSKKFKYITLSSYLKKGIRTPSLIEKFGDNIKIIPNNELKNEKSIYYYSLKSTIHTLFNIEMEYNKNRLDDKITPNVFNGGFIKFLNINKSSISNLNINIYNNKPLLKKFNIFSSYSKNIGKNISDGNLYNKKIPFLFDNIFKTTLEYTINKHIMLTLNYNYFSNTYTNNANFIYQHPTNYDLLINGEYGFLPAQHKFNIGILYTKNYFSCNIELNNIFNNRVALSSNIYNRGRVAKITLGLEY